MTRNRLLHTALAITMIGGASFGVPSQSVQQLTRPHVRKHELKPVPPDAVPRQVALLRMLPPEGVTADTYYWLSVKRNDFARNSPPTEIRFMVGSPEPDVAIFTDETSDQFLYAVLPDGGSSSVVATVWDTGSYIHTRVFSLVGGRVTPLIDHAAHFPPEFVLGAILLNTGWVPLGEQCCTADKTEIWMWSREKYDLAGTVPFQQRYAALQRLLRAAPE